MTCAIVCGDQEDGIAIEEHLSSAPQAVKRLLEEVGGRTVALNARAPPIGAGRQKQQGEVLEAVARVVEQQGATPYTGTDKPKKMRMKHARRLRQLAEREKEAAKRGGGTGGGDSGGSWLGWLYNLVAPSPA